MISTDITFNKKDLNQAFNLHYAANFPIKSKLMLFSGFLLLVMGIILFTTSALELPYLKYIFIGLGIFYIFFHFFKRKNMVESALRNPGIKGIKSMEISDKKISLIGEKGVSEKTWKQFIDKAQDENIILLYFDKMQFYMVPKRLFSKEELSKIEKYLKVIK